MVAIDVANPQSNNRHTPLLSKMLSAAFYTCSLRQIRVLFSPLNGHSGTKRRLSHRTTYTAATKKRFVKEGQGTADVAPKSVVLNLYRLKEFTNYSLVTKRKDLCLAQSTTQIRKQRSQMACIFVCILILRDVSCDRSTIRAEQFNFAVE